MPPVKTELQAGGSSLSILYDTPKVTGTDCRDGVVTIFPRDRKRVQQSALLAAVGKEQAPSFWKRHFSGTPRDWKLLDLLDEMPKLREHVANPRRCKGREVPFFGGEGIQPHGGDPNQAWWGETAFLDADSAAIALYVFDEDCSTAKEHLPRLVHRERDERLFKPPLVVISRGFGKVAFIDFPVVFQHALYSIVPSDERSAEREMKGNILRFLAVFLRSKLAWYYIFHTASSLALERDQVHRVELLELPFPLPGHEYANPKAHELVNEVAGSFDLSRREVLEGLKRLHRERERLGLEARSKEFASMLRSFTVTRLQRVKSVQDSLENLVFRYFDLTKEEIDLVEDTVSVYHPSATPTSREIVRQGNMASLEPVTNSALQDYASLLTGTLNGWAEGARLRVSASAAPLDDRPFVLLSLRQARAPVRFRIEKVTRRTEALLERIYDAARRTQGRLEYPRAVTFFDGASIHLLKPVSLMHWTRTAALNDADEIFAEVIRQRRAKSA